MGVIEERRRKLELQKYFINWFQGYDLNLRCYKWMAIGEKREKGRVFSAMGSLLKSRKICRKELKKCEKVQRSAILRHYLREMHKEWKVRRFRLYRSLQEKLVLERTAFGSLAEYKDIGLRQKALL